MNIHYWCCLNSLHSLHRYSGLNEGSRWLSNSGSCNSSTFNYLTSSHFLFNSVFDSFFLSGVLNFLFNSLSWKIVSLGLVGNFRDVFNLVVNNLVFSDVFINGNSNSLFKLIVFSDYLFVRHVFESAFSFHNLAQLRSNLCSLK